MYLDFFGLGQDPFHVTPDAAFFCPSRSHREAYSAIAYGVGQRKGFVLVTGEVGTGKTTVVRTFLQELNQADVDCFYVLDPDLTFDELLQLLLRQMGFNMKNRPKAWMLRWLRTLLVLKYRANRTVAVIVDEAQNMPDETLEKLRMLSNLETSANKLLQVVLVGQPELDEKLQQHSLRQLRQRIAIRTQLAPLNADECVEYLRHRVKVVGGDLEYLFAPAAIKRIIRYSKGIPRVLNIASSNALLAAYATQQRPVPDWVVNEVIADLEGHTRRFPFKSLLSWFARGTPN